MTDYDVVVAGAGIAGSSVSKALADRGWRTLCVDRRSFPRHKVCGEFLSTEARRTLRELKLIEPVQSLRPAEIERACLFSDDQEHVLEIPIPEHAWGISRYALDDALHEAAAQSGVHMAMGTMLTTMRREGGEYVVELRRGAERSSIRARAVIAAWGNRSRIVDRKSTQSANRTYIGLKCHLEGIHSASAVELYIVPGGYIGIAPIEGGRLNMSGLLQHHLTTDRQRSIEDHLLTAALHNPALEQRLRGAVFVPGSEAAIYPVVLDRAPRLWDECPCIGDAGLMIPPLCGDGMSIALYTAKVCAASTDRYLSGAIDLGTWRVEYEKAVRAVVDRPLYWGRLLHRFTHMPFARRQILSLSRSIPSLARHLLKATRLDL